MKVLFLSSWFPSPPINGAKIRINNLLWYLTQHHDVTLISFVNTLSPEVLKEEIPKWEQRCRRVITMPRPTPNRLLGTIGFFTPLPKYVVSTYRAGIMRLISKEFSSYNYDILIASDVGSGGGMPLYGGRVPCRRRIVDGIEFNATEVMRADSTHTFHFRPALTYWKAKSYVRNMLRRFDACTVPSEIELSRIKPLAQSTTSVSVVPHGLDLEHLFTNPAQSSDRNTAVFCGSLTFGPNADAFNYYMHDIRPLVHSEVTEISLNVVGNTQGFDIRSLLNESDVVFQGHQRDVRPFIWRSRMSIVPLRLGSGTRLKILESMALGTPVISTTKGAEGLHVTPEHDILIADTPADFSQQMMRLFRDDELRNRLSINGRKTVESLYDRRVVGRLFEQLMEEVVRR